MEIGADRTTFLHDPGSASRANRYGEVVLAWPHQWPGAETGACPKGIDRPDRDRSTSSISLGEREPGEGHEREADRERAGMSVLDRIDGVDQPRSCLVEVAGLDGEHSELRPGAAREPRVAELAPQFVDLEQVLAGDLVVGRASSSSMPTVSKANATNGSFCSRKPVSALAAAASAPSKSSTIGQRPRDRQPQRIGEVRIVDRRGRRSIAVDRRQRTVVVADLDGRHRPREQHLGPGMIIQRRRPGVAARRSTPGPRASDRSSARTTTATGRCAATA